MRITRAGFGRPNTNTRQVFVLAAACNILLFTFAVLGALNSGGAV